MSLSIKSILWFLGHPSSYVECFRKIGFAIKKRFGKKTDSAQWCKERAISPEEVITRLTGEIREIDWIPSYSQSNALLLYNCAEYLEATKVIETGVCRGASSSGILKSLRNRDGRLISTDIPTPELYAEPGEVVTDDLKAYWTVIQKPDRVALPAAIKELGTLDLATYDSDKSYSGRMFGYEILWNALRKDGIFISDDINDNFAFRDFCESKSLEPLIAINGERYVGAVVK
jgi:predicted O-methyltransferase YrrM